MTKLGQLTDHGQYSRAGLAVQQSFFFRQIGGRSAQIPAKYNMGPRAKKILEIAMKCDALESATYSRFAAHARMDSDWELARTLQENADGDRTENFAKEAALEDLRIQPGKPS